MSIQALRRHRRGKYNELRAMLPINDAGEVDYSASDEEWTDEKQAKFDRIKAELERMDAEIVRYEAVNDLAGQAGIRDAADRAGRSVDETQARANAHLEAYATFIRDGWQNLDDDQRRLMAMSTTDGEGGYTIPEEVSRQLPHAMRDQNGLRMAGSVQGSRNGRGFTLPYIDDLANDGDGKAENAEVTEEDIATQGRKLVFVVASSGIVPLSEELLQDTETQDLPGVVNTLLLERISRQQEVKWSASEANSGAYSEVYGFMRDASSGVTAAEQAVIAPGELMNLYAAVRGPYRRNGAWMFNSTVLGLLMNLSNETNGLPIWLPGNIEGGEPARLLGRPLPHQREHGQRGGRQEAGGVRPVLAVHHPRLAHHDAALHRLGLRQQRPSGPAHSDALWCASVGIQRRGEFAGSLPHDEGVGGGSKRKEDWPMADQEGDGAAAPEHEVDEEETTRGTASVDWVPKTAADRDPDGPAEQYYVNGDTISGLPVDVARGYFRFCMVSAPAKPDRTERRQWKQIAASA